MLRQLCQERPHRRRHHHHPHQFNVHFLPRLIIKGMEYYGRLLPNSI